LDIY
jgi:hypothetical protein